MNMKSKDVTLTDLLTGRNMYIITAVICSIIALFYELGYCNYEFLIGTIQNYNFSFYRIIVYIVLFILIFILKDKLIKEATDTMQSKLKSSIVAIMILYTFFITTVLITLVCITKQLDISWVILELFFLMLNLFLIYISNNMLKNIALTAIIFGSIFSISITFNNQLDEKIHFLTSYSISIGRVDLKEPAVDEAVANMPKMMNVRQFIEYFNVHPTNNIKDDFTDTFVTDRPTDYLTISYLVSGAGIFIARTLGGSVADIYITGRIFNLLGYIAIMITAMKILPYKKNILYAIFFMPMLLTLGSVYSADGISTATIALFIAYCLKIHEKENISKKELLLLILLLIIATTVKSVGYIGIALIIFILPVIKIIKQNKKYLKYIIPLFIVLLILVISVYIVSINKPGDPRTQGTNTIEQFWYIINNPVTYIKVFMEHTIFTFTNLECISFINAPMFFHQTYYLVFIPLLTYILFISITDSSKHLKLRTRLIFVFTFLIAYAMVSTAMYLSYTPLGAKYIDGFQMRYFFPVLFLLLSSLSIRKFELENKFKLNNLYIGYMSSIFLIISALDNII